MKAVLFAVVMICLFSCGGSLSSEQRKKIRENMNAGAIKKISDAQLTEAALEFGRQIEKKVNTSLGQAAIDTLENNFKVEIIFMAEGQRNELRAVERQILEAYLETPNISTADNIQRMGKDSLLYTKPIFKELPDGSQRFVKAMAIRIPKKSVILSIKQ